jgi:hypothetical protein
MTYCSSPVKYEFLAVHQVGLMTHVTGENRSPSRWYMYWVTYLNWLFGT